jgi:hypothetical protein
MTPVGLPPGGHHRRVDVRDRPAAVAEPAARILVRTGGRLNDAVEGDMANHGDHHGEPRSVTVVIDPSAGERSALSGEPVRRKLDDARRVLREVAVPHPGRPRCLKLLVVSVKTGETPESAAAA